MAFSILSLKTLCVPAVPSYRMAIMECREIKHIKCMQITCDPELTIARRSSAKYLPAICDYDFIQSMNSAYKGEAHDDERFEFLKYYTRGLLEDKLDTIERLELISTLERLGVSYLFEIEIKQSLESLVFDSTRAGDLHFAALSFRILRQNGHLISQDVFGPFIGENGSFREDLSKDTKGILSLYEASFLSLEGESIMDEARVFTTRHLTHFLAKNSKCKTTMLCQLVEHALAIPLHWMPPRVEARWFMDVYAREEKDHNLLELAKLDYNMCQATAQADLKSVSRWWKNLGVAESLNFTKDRLPEGFILALGMVSQRKYGHAREGMTQLVQLVVTIDDLYEHYGIIEELQLFTNAVERWDVNEVQQLPACMRLCYLGLLNTCNQFAHETLRLKGCNIIPLLKKYWLDLCKSFLREAKWLDQGYTPTLDEYLDNAMMSVGVLVVIGIGYFLMSQEVNNATLDLMATYPDLIQLSAMIFRLSDDIGESIGEIDEEAPNSINYYMVEKGATQEAALKHVRLLLSECWKEMNKNLVASSPFQKDYIDAAMGFARIAHWLYLNGDGFSTDRQRALDTFKLMVVEPIPLDN